MTSSYSNRLHPPPVLYHARYGNDGLSYISTPSSNLLACGRRAREADDLPSGENGPRARPARVSERGAATGDCQAEHCPRRVGSRSAGAVAEYDRIAGCDLIGEWPGAMGARPRPSVIPQ